MQGIWHRCAGPTVSADICLKVKTVTLDGGPGRELCVVENHLLMSYTSVIQCKIPFITQHAAINHYRLMSSSLRQPHVPVPPSDGRCTWHVWSKVKDRSLIVDRTDIFWATVRTTVCPMLSDRCLSCL